MSHNRRYRKPDEVFEYGPIRMERFGRYIQTSTRWNSAEFQQYQKSLRENRPAHKEKITKDIQQLISCARQSNPLDLLTEVALTNTLADPETYTESTYKGQESLVDYAHSILLGIKEEAYAFDHPNEKASERFIELLPKIMNGVLWYFETEVSEKNRDEVKERIRFESITHFLYVRGDSYSEHHAELVAALFQPHDAFLLGNFGFTSKQIMQALKEIEDTIVSELNSQFHIIAILKHLHRLFKDLVDREVQESHGNEHEIMQRYNSLPEVQTGKEKLEVLRVGKFENPFLFLPTPTAPASLLHQLSSCFGDNRSFISFEKFPGWPTNDSILFERPIVKHKGKFYCFAVPTLFRNIGKILDRWIEMKDPQYYKDRFRKRCSGFLEEKTMAYVSQLLPNSISHCNIFYPGTDDGKPCTFETDGILIFDTHLFIEAKSAALSLSARRGSLDRTMRDVGKIINDAHIQSTRVLQYIKDNEKPTFYYEDGGTAFVLDKKSVGHIYLVNTTLDSLHHLATALESLKAFKFIQGKEWLWSVFINDLRVIAEIVDSPSVFIHYLQRRIRANDFPQFQSADELDFFMFYLYEGLHFEDADLKNHDFITPRAYSEDLDRYYDFLAGRVTTGKKPQLKVNHRLKDFILKVERSGKKGFTEVTTVLLGINNDAQQAVVAGIEECKARALKDAEEHDFTITFKQTSTGFLFSVSAQREDSSLSRLSAFCELKMYQMKLPKWGLVSIDVDNNGKEAVDFRLFEKHWSFDAEMEQKLKIFQRSKMHEYRSSGQKPERNKQCPCGSGKKYKKCCDLQGL